MKTFFLQSEKRAALIACRLAPQRLTCHHLAAPACHPQRRRARLQSAKQLQRQKGFKCSSRPPLRLRRSLPGLKAQLHSGSQRSLVLGCLQRQSQMQGRLLLPMAGRQRVVAKAPRRQQRPLLLQSWAGLALMMASVMALPV